MTTGCLTAQPGPHLLPAPGLFWKLLYFTAASGLLCLSQGSAGSLTVRSRGSSAVETPPAGVGHLPSLELDSWVPTSLCMGGMWGPELYVGMGGRVMHGRTWDQAVYVTVRGVCMAGILGLRGWSLATPGDTWQGLSCRQGGGCRGLWPRPGAESPTRAPKLDCSVSAGLSTAREVHVPPGPLLRVEGTAVAIPCHVTEYEGSTLQHFEWSVYRSAAPTIAIGIISTKDPAFPYAVFSSRVQSGDVAMQRLRGDAVELRIAHLQPEDDGIYECYTPSTDSQYHGSYSSKVALKGTVPHTG